MEILEGFGFDPTLFIAQIVNFLLLAYIFKRFMYKPLTRVLDERKQKIEKGLKEAEEAHTALENAQQERDELIKRSTIEAERLLEQAKNSAEKTKGDIIAQAQLEAQKIISEGKESARIEYENMQKDAHKTALSLSEKILESVLLGIFSQDERDKIMKKGIKEIEKYGKQNN